MRLAWIKRQLSAEDSVLGKWEWVCESPTTVTSHDMNVGGKLYCRAQCLSTCLSLSRSPDEQSLWFVHLAGFIADEAVVDKATCRIPCPLILATNTSTPQYGQANGKTFRPNGACEIGHLRKLGSVTSICDGARTVNRSDSCNFPDTKIDCFHQVLSF